MSDYEDSTVTYTEVSSPFADLSDIGSPGVDGPPVMPDDPYAYAPPSPVYVPYVPEPAYPEFMPLRIEGTLDGRRKQPCCCSLTTMLIVRDDGDDEDESSDDDEDDDVDIEGDEEEEEHPAPADSIVVALPAVDHDPLLRGV
ncbi:hypothetical protein Tco_1473330 [Tanacetum coccineum]